MPCHCHFQQDLCECEQEIIRITMVIPRALSCHCQCNEILKIEEKKRKLKLNNGYTTNKCWYMMKIDIIHNKQMLICEEAKYHIEPSLLSLCRPRQNFVSLLHCNIYIIHILNMISLISSVPKIITLLHCIVIISFHEHTEHHYVYEILSPVL